MKTTGKILVTVMLLYLLATPVYLSGRVKQIKCSSVEITVSDSSENGLITRGEVASMVRKEGTTLAGTGLKEIKLNEIEERIRARNEIKSAEAYVTIDGTLRIAVTPREPVLRLIVNGSDYFMDDEGVLFRKRKLYTPRVHVVTGNFEIRGPVAEGVSVLDTAAGETILKDVYNLVGFIRRDRFWSAQIDQIRVAGNGDISLVPRTAGHIINIGKIDGLEEKLENLKALYDKIMPLAGWDAYSLIDLQYKDQVVCRKKPK
ncbi:MAG TPA: hypothetical protein P5257_09370 [Bacteroidales bacterium]|nr:hypothetical protein [Bacteroidales bacterium]HRR92851.1 hypothetical protein [Bacteroidales bacterium]HRT90315.1 hypothetical protein [Bacteroidales bacterium]